MTKIEFTRLPDIDAKEILFHMSDPRLMEHMPLLTGAWGLSDVARFVEAKEQCWSRDGLGHWAILHNGNYVGWGGFQKEEGEWDYGLVLKPDSFGLGGRITRKALDFAASDPRIPFVTFLLPPSRTKTGALLRLGAEFIGETEYEGALFRKYRLNTG
ncbi:GNAT family N-acetyltransferase [Ruegeria profundi]|nr:GNAT family N-acetyltransferase [Ruegeria profundi]